jgi:hypothetical protein
MSGALQIAKSMPSRKKEAFSAFRRKVGQGAWKAKRRGFGSDAPSGRAGMRAVTARRTPKFRLDSDRISHEFHGNAALAACARNSGERANVVQTHSDVSYRHAAKRERAFRNQGTEDRE